MAPLRVCWYSTLLAVITFGARNEVTAQSGKSHVFYLLSLLSYPNNNTSLKPSITDAYSVIPGIQLAISDINNRSDVLADYRLELIEAEDGCNVDWIGVTSLIDNLYYKENKQIVGIIGPECSDSTKVVASITGRPEIALLNIHTGSAPELSDRTLYPYSYGIRSPTSIQIDAVVALFRYNKWTSAAVLYNPEMLVDYNSFLLFQERIKGTANLTYTSYASPTYLPLEQLRRSYVRVIVSFLRDETLQRVLCLSYYKNMTYPRYQWILFEPNKDTNVSFSYEGRQYECTDDQLVSAQSKSIGISSDNIEDDTPTISDIEDETIIDGCQDSLDCYVLFDAVWAIALALNSSIGPLAEKELSLSNYTFGKHAYTEIIRDQMNALSFNGIWRRVQFDSNTGFIFNVTSSIYYSDYDYTIGNYSFPEGVLQIDSSSADFVSTNFDERLILVSLPLAVVIIIVGVVAAVLVVMVHILNTVYSHRKTIKISSRRLNHLAYIGCYIILIGLLLYSIMEALHINQKAKNVLCNAFPWTLITGLTLVFGTVLAKAWRLYHIFKSALKNRKSSKFAIKDSTLLIGIITLLGLSAVLCFVWTFYDPLVRKRDTTLTPEGYTLVLAVKESCSCKYEAEWVAVGAAYEAVLIICTVIFAFSTRNITIKELQSQGTILMAYLLTLTSIVGSVTYYITRTIGAETDVPYAILSFFLLIIVYLCIFLLFLPPVVPVMKEWPVVKKWPGLKGLPVIKHFPCWSGKIKFGDGSTN